MNDLKHFQIITHSPTSDPVGQAWYSVILIDYIKVTKAIVEYMDGSSDTVSCDVVMFRDRFDKYKYK